MPEMNYNPLLGRIKEFGLTQKECAKILGISEGQLSRKLSQPVEKGHRKVAFFLIEEENAV